jgi:DNA-binding NarL/FixJ family response regulator
MTHRVLLADDHDLFRRALRQTLEAVSDMEVVAEAVDGLTAIESARQVLPDVVCMDVNMPGLDGVDATVRLLDVQPDVKVIGLSAHFDLHLVARMISAGAHGYVIKHSAGVELVLAIRTVTRHETYLSPGLGVTSAAELARYLN